MISIVINCDTRPGFDTGVSKVGDASGVELIGCRNTDFLTDGVRNKRHFFRGHDVELILCIDKHLDLPLDIFAEINEMISSGIINTFEFEARPRNKRRWNDYTYVNALRKAKGDYIAHYDGDNAAFRADSSSIVDDYIKWLDSGQYDFISQPTNLSRQEHGMWWASTRFFIAKRSWFDFDEVERCIDSGYLLSKYKFIDHPYPCCLEHTLGVMAGDGRVLYPPRDDSQYLSFSWTHYHAGTYKKLMAMPYEEVADIVANKWGLCGPNDVVGQPL